MSSAFSASNTTYICTLLSTVFDTKHRPMNSKCYEYLSYAKSLQGRIFRIGGAAPDGAPSRQHCCHPPAVRTARWQVRIFHQIAWAHVSYSVKILAALMVLPLSTKDAERSLLPSTCAAVWRSCCWRGLGPWSTCGRCSTPWTPTWPMTCSLPRSDSEAKCCL